LPRAIRVTLRDPNGRILGASTAATVHSEVPADCVLVQGGGDCLAPAAQPETPTQDAPGTSSDMDNRPLQPRR